MNEWQFWRGQTIKHLVATAKGIELFICKCTVNQILSLIQGCNLILLYEVHIVLFCSLYSLISLKFKIENNNSDVVVFFKIVKKQFSLIWYIADSKGVSI